MANAAKRMRRGTFTLLQASEDAKRVVKDLADLNSKKVQLDAQQRRLQECEGDT